MLAGAARAQHPAAGVQYQLETLRSPHVRGRETGTIGNKTVISSEAQRSKMLVQGNRYLRFFWKTHATRQGHPPVSVRLQVGPPGI